MNLKYLNILNSNMTKHCITCIKDDKKTIAAFGNPDGKPMYCSKHKETQMINLSRPYCKCEIPKQAYFNHKDKTKPEYVSFNFSRKLGREIQEAEF